MKANKPEKISDILKKHAVVPSMAKARAKLLKRIIELEKITISTKNSKLVFKEKKMKKETKLWLVFKWREGSPEPEFQGVFSKEDRAIEACHDETHCICPAILDKEYSQDYAEWPDAWYPNLKNIQE